MADDEVEGGTGRDEEHRTEGVRIIGAQEAAEAAGRPDVARRRRRGEKRFGDRPDPMEPEPDLPTVRISSSGDVEPVDPGDRFGAVPIVRPGGDPPSSGDEPKWADEGFSAVPEPGSERSFGHARVVEEPIEVGASEVVDEPPTGTAGAEEPPAEERGDRASTPSWEPEPEATWSDEPSTVGAGSAGDPWEPADAGGGSASTDEAGSGGDEFGELADDSFVLPHWTEPATGQVPKVVIGDEPDPDPLTTTGSQPRWRDEGERTVETDFEDLLEDAPRLGALAGDQPDPDLEDAFFDDEGDRDPLSAFAPEGDLDLEGAVATRRREPTRTRRRGGRSGREADDERREEHRGGGAGGGDRNLPVAVGIGVALGLIGLGAFAWGGLPTTLLACVVVGAAAFEYFTAVQRAGNHPATLLGLTAVVGLLLATYFEALSAYPVVLTLTVVLGLLWYLWVAPGERSVPNLGLTLLGVLWIGLLGSFATLFLGLGRQMTEADPDLTSNPGIGVLIAAVIVSVSHDVGAYFIGRFYGRTALSAASPNKTLEGLAGGVITALVLTVVVVGFFGIAPVGEELPQTFIFALLCACVAPLGDLCESFIKRDLGIKDMGAILPGHGGVLDRFDSLLFVLPTAYFVTVVLDIWA